MQRKLTDEQELKMCEEYLNPEIREIDLVEKYGVSVWYLTDCRKRHNVPRRPKIKTGCYEINENYFENLDSSDKVYHLGFITGDGSLSKTCNRLTIVLNTKDIDYLIKFKSNIQSDHPILTKSVFDKRTNKFYNRCEIEITREKFYNDLNKYISPNKSKDLSVPKIEDRFMNHYLRGLVDSDGGFSIKTGNQLYLCIVSSVYSYLEEIQNILIEKCNLSRGKIFEHKGCWEIIWGGNDQCKRIYDYLYSDGGPWLDRKYNLTTNHYNNIANGIKLEKKPKTITENPKILSDLDRILGFGK
jgi:intein-encoded DNA endonuclease-like protein